MVSAHRTEVCLTPRPIMPAKISAKHCDSLPRDYTEFAEMASGALVALLMMGAIHAI